jgi:hypothetical protein
MARHYGHVVQAENEDEGCIEFTAMSHSGPAYRIDGRASAPSFQQLAMGSEGVHDCRARSSGSDAATLAAAARTL